MKTIVTKLLSIAVLVSVATVRADESKLGDVMQLIYDQYAGLADLAKKAPADLDPKAFARAESRCRGAQWLLEKADLAKGSVDLGVVKEGEPNDTSDDKLVAAELTPPKFVNLKPEELVTSMTLYSETLKKVSTLFETIDNEIKVQAEAEPAKRDFTILKKLVVKDLTAEMTAAHKLFK